MDYLLCLLVLLTHIPNDLLEVQEMKDLLGLILVVVLLVGGSIGWILNLFKLISQGGFFRLVGVFFPPLGGLIGWF